MRAVSGADLQKPPVQLPAAGRESFRWNRGPPKRPPLQRGLAAPRLRSPATPCLRSDQPAASGKRTTGGRLAAGRGSARRPTDADQSIRRPARDDDATRRWMMSPLRHRLYVGFVAVLAVA